MFPLSFSAIIHLWSKCSVKRIEKVGDYQSGYLEDLWKSRVILQKLMWKGSAKGKNAARIRCWTMLIQWQVGKRLPKFSECMAFKRVPKNRNAQSFRNTAFISLPLSPFSPRPPANSSVDKTHPNSLPNLPLPSTLPSLPLATCPLLATLPLELADFVDVAAVESAELTEADWKPVHFTGFPDRVYLDRQTSLKAMNTSLEKNTLGN